MLKKTDEEFSATQNNNQSYGLKQEKNFKNNYIVERYLDLKPKT